MPAHNCVASPHSAVQESDYGWTDGKVREGVAWDCLQPSVSYTVASIAPCREAALGCMHRPLRRLQRRSRVAALGTHPTSEPCFACRQTFHCVCPKPKPKVSSFTERSIWPVPLAAEKLFATILKQLPRLLVHPTVWGMCLRIPAQWTSAVWLPWFCAHASAALAGASTCSDSKPACLPSRLRARLQVVVVPIVKPVIPIVKVRAL